MKPYALILALLATTSLSHAASFDCAKASTLVETAVCSNRHISILDEALTQSYKDALVNAPNAKGTRAAQRAWIKNVRDKCTDVACLERAYKKRIAELDKTTGKAVGIGYTGTYVADNGDLKIRQDADGRIRFSIYSTYEGMSMTSTGEAAGEIALNGKTGTYVNKDEQCSLTFTFGKDVIDVVQEGACQMGINVNASGTYERVNRSVPKFD